MYMYIYMRVEREKETPARFGYLQLVFDKGSSLKGDGAARVVCDAL